MVFFKVAAEPRIVVAVPADGLFEVMVSVFETFVQEVSGDRKG